jgi:hypothetical protein
MAKEAIKTLMASRWVCRCGSVRSCSRTYSDAFCEAIPATCMIAALPASSALL